MDLDNFLKGGDETETAPAREKVHTFPQEEIIVPRQNTKPSHPPITEDGKRVIETKQIRPDRQMPTVSNDEYQRKIDLLEQRLFQFENDLKKVQEKEY